jgi:hypothetical protein
MNAQYITSKLLTSTGFSRKIFFFSIFLVGDSLVKKSTVCIKSGFMICQNQNFDFALQNAPTNFFPRVSKLPAVLLTSTSTYILVEKLEK